MFGLSFVMHYFVSFLILQGRESWLLCFLKLLKNMLSNIVKRYMRDLVKTYFGQLKIHVKF